MYRVDHLMTPQRNLDLQTRIIANARAFVGTYGGLAYVAPFYGVPSVGFYSQESDLMSAHLDVGWRLGRDDGRSAGRTGRQECRSVADVVRDSGAAGRRRPDGRQGGLGRAAINSPDRRLPALERRSYRLSDSM